MNTESIVDKFFPQPDKSVAMRSHTMSRKLARRLCQDAIELAIQKNGDDDSVTHSWNTTPVSVVVDIDSGIAPLVAALNKIPGVRTFASCEGHPHSSMETNGVSHKNPYVTLYIGDVEMVKRLADAINNALLQEVDADGGTRKDPQGIESLDSPLSTSASAVPPK